MQDSKVVYSIFIFARRYPFSVNMLQMIKIMNLDLPEYENLMAMFPHSVLDQKYPFTANLVKEKKVLSLT